jgi:hypothetical protein
MAVYVGLDDDFIDPDEEEEDASTSSTGSYFQANASTRNVAKSSPHFTPQKAPTPLSQSTPNSNKGIKPLVPVAKKQKPDAPTTTTTTSTFFNKFKYKSNE